MTRFAFKPPVRLGSAAASLSLALMLSVSVSHEAMAACAPSSTLTVGIECEGEQENTSHITITDGGNAGDKFAPGLVSDLFANSALNASFTPATAITVSGILVTPIDGEGNLKNSGDIENTMSNDKILDNAVKTTAKTTVHVPPGGWGSSTPSGTTTYTVTDKDGAVTTVARAATAAEIRAITAAPVVNGDGSKDYARTFGADTISSSSNVANIIGINANDDGEYNIENTGNIKLSHAGVGQLYGIAGNGDVEELNVTNSGKIEVERDSIVITRLRSDAIQARPDDVTASVGTIPNAGLQVAAGVFVEEELESFSLDNEKSGTISVSGSLAAGVYSRAAEFSLINDGLIEHTDGPGGGIAIAAVSDSGITSTAEIENRGTISGDIVMTNGHALRWWGLNVLGPIDASTALQKDYLRINSQFGQLDSTIVNSGTITGDFYYSNGAHVLSNESEGTIEGDIHVDQRRTLAPGRSCTVGSEGCFATGVAVGDAVQGNPAHGELPASENSASIVTAVDNSAAVIANPDLGIAGAAAGATQSATFDISIWGSKTFTLENAGDMEDVDLTIFTSPATTIYGFDVADSRNVLKPHIFGGGAGSTAALPSENSGFIDDLTVVDVDNSGNVTGGSLSRTTTIAPVIDSVVKSGEWYLVAKELDVLNVGDTPEVEGTVLVSWTADAAAGAGGDSLAIQATVADASSVEGLSKPGISALNGLLSVEDSDSDAGALAGAVQNLSEEDDVRKAGEQLKPETNYATQQAAILLNQVTGQHIEARLASVGATGSSGNSFPQPSGLGMKQNDPNRSNLGGSTPSVDAGPSQGGGALWGRAFGVGFNQDEIENVDGYDARLYGILAGYDNWAAPGVRVGVAIGYANTDIDGEGDTKANKTGIDSYLAELYASYRGSGWYATGRTGFTWHDYETTRVLSVPVQDVAKGDHDGDQYNAALELGAPMHVGGGNILTPVASLTYSKLRQDGYKETSDAGMGLSVGDQNNDSLVSGLGLKALVPIAVDTVLEARALWLHEFSDDAQDVTASFAAGGATFTAAGPGVGRDSAALGLGLLAQIGPESTFQLNYDANIREDYLAHIGSAQLSVRY